MHVGEEVVGEVKAVVEVDGLAIDGGDEDDGYEEDHQEG